jgi:hypothetical protein
VDYDKRANELPEEMVSIICDNCLVYLGLILKKEPSFLKKLPVFTFSEEKKFSSPVVSASPRETNSSPARSSVSSTATKRKKPIAVETTDLMSSPPPPADTDRTVFL